jgi:hypothetical protein
MHGPASVCEAEYQTVRSIPVLWIVFNDLAALECFTNLSYADLPDNALINRMLRELELPSCNLGPKLYDHRPSLCLEPAYQDYSIRIERVKEIS